MVICTLYVHITMVDFRYKKIVLLAIKYLEPAQIIFLNIKIDNWELHRSIFVLKYCRKIRHGYIYKRVYIYPWDRRIVTINPGTFPLFSYFFF